MNQSDGTTPKPTRTSKRSEILRAMITLEDSGKQVTLRKVAALAGLKSPSSVHNQLRLLVATGHATATPIEGLASRSQYTISAAGRAELATTS
jgi:hypothetical protein